MLYGVMFYLQKTVMYRNVDLSGTTTITQLFSTSGENRMMRLLVGVKIRSVLWNS